MLIRQLHEMVEDGILLRPDKKSVPPLSLFDLGHSSNGQNFAR